MPVKIQSVGKGKYKVSTPRGTKAKHTTKAKAEKQKRLLNAIDHGFKPTGRPAKKKTRTESLALKVVQTLLENVKEKLSRFLLDDIDSDYGFYSRASTYLRGHVLRSKEEWESAQSGQELVDELCSGCPETKIQSLLRKLQED